MGFTPLDGLMMASRSGSLDPGILLHVQLRHGLGAKEVEQALNHESGLLGISGVSGDLREVQAAARGGDERARILVIATREDLTMLDEVLRVIGAQPTGART